MSVSTGFCENCGKQVNLERRDCSHILHLIFTVLTGGLWIPVWIVMALATGPWRCRFCGLACRPGNCGRVL